MLPLMLFLLIISKYSNVGGIIILYLSANFKGIFTIGPAPLTVKFTNLSSGEYDTCLWEFGDGGTSNICENPEYTYTADGEYDVSLTITGADGTDTLKKPGYIWVGDFNYAYGPVILTP